MRNRILHLILFMLFTHSEILHCERNTIMLENEWVKAVFDLGGGALADFHFKDQGLNPLSWNHPESGDMKAQKMGHFICFDRLGRPSKQEIAKGMPGHGEAQQCFWEGALSDKSTVTMSCELPLAKMRVDRTVVLSGKASVLMVKETFTNRNPLGKLCNIVQHPSIGWPFLDHSVLVDSNAWKGFATGNPMPILEEPIVYWNHIVKNGKVEDLRKLVPGDSPKVVSFICGKDAPLGWITASNPGKNLLIGYVWSTRDYYWIRHWYHIVENKALARGLEFGTTPLPLPFGDILKKGPIFDMPTILYLDSEEKTEKEYIAFLLEIPDTFQGVESVANDNNLITVTEKNTGQKYTLSY